MLLSLCENGTFCSEVNHLLTGLTTVTGPCNAGYYCPENSRNIDELECPMGFWCPIQTHYPQQCENGTFSNATGMAINFCQRIF